MCTKFDILPYVQYQKNKEHSSKPYRKVRNDEKPTNFPRNYPDWLWGLFLSTAIKYYVI